MSEFLWKLLLPQLGLVAWLGGVNFVALGGTSVNDPYALMGKCIFIFCSIPLALKLGEVLGVGPKYMQSFLLWVAGVFLLTIAALLR